MMPDFPAALLPIAALIAVYMTAWFFIALVRRDNSVADIAWGLGFVFVAAVTVLGREAGAARSTLATAFVVVWGGRLSLHIFRRNRKKGEDPRYADWRRAWGRAFVWRSFLQVFMLQGLFLALISSPVAAVNLAAEQGRLNLLDAVGTALWLAGFAFEAVGDAQLARFKRDPANRGRIMTSGLWRYTRHPNYFGESLMWGGLFVLALNVPGGWMTVVSPVLITFLLVQVSGIPLLEKRYAGNTEFQAYARRTSAFIPRPPKNV
jgi:steroid 5-alpha reductase family enzyme